MSEIAENLAGGVAGHTAAQPPRDRSRRRRASRDPAGRTQILDAAVACILELGFYRASTNEIARRANVSWGAIQYYFGSRESLMIAAVEELNRRFIASIAQRHVEGETLEERVEALYELLAQYYSAPAYLARMQIMLNLQSDPDTSAEASAALADMSTQVADQIRRLLTEALGPDADPARNSALFHAIRGFAVSRQLAESIDPEHGRHDDEVRRIFLASIVATERRSH
ncbi:TetR family transcriptional regulator [Frankia sp. CNm7]|uniref:TetR family transcriptional regulator n=1 Tax=Frankia nepalensis TaxID=1836974 RepID=A0A937RJ42_9ACTN|nr:TetR/AcrR family transcriptional regulator [Frankia nepalensis]MBL7499237.1 TetR family transcriptional regulator [Frankia nepalensis]MBL7512117.1 TetR family transcriptional regulator [Frankia nepalensis]MBL7521034.1 TetR family transcriptional regulator [Frankia nepalensis]MBL7627308.1 TetR family transcriptional regulator [Frankia nepalensis]